MRTCYQNTHPSIGSIFRDYFSGRKGMDRGPLKALAPPRPECSAYRDHRRRITGATESFAIPPLPQPWGDSSMDGKLMGMFWNHASARLRMVS